MKRFTALFLVCACVSGCTLLRPEGTLVNGSVWLVSQTDMHQAVAAARLAGPDFTKAPLDSVVVDSRSRLYVYFAGYPHGLGAIVERVDGRWRCVGTIAMVIVG